MISLLMLPLMGVTAGVFLPKTARPYWGFTNGVQVALFPSAIGNQPGDGGPRGLLRIGYPFLSDGGSGLVNFIAIEPVVGGRRGFSELERSATDGKPGKLFQLESSREGTLRGGVPYRTYRVSVERFDNGAHVHVEIRFRADRPDEVELRAFAEPDSAPIQECVFTATMGNYERVRELFLKTGVVNSHAVYPNYTGDGFAEDRFFPLPELLKDRRGDVIVPFTSDEADPHSSQDSLPPGIFWRYAGRKVTQFWKAPKGTFSPALKLRVNARRVYWMSRIPLPGGIAFENVELRDWFRSGQPFVFGMTLQALPDGLKLPQTRSRG